MRRGGFVGRERDRLEAGLTAALGGAGQAMLVAGEPGVGKSRLAEEVVERATRRGMDHAWGRANAATAMTQLMTAPRIDRTDREPDLAPTRPDQDHGRRPRLAYR